MSNLFETENRIYKYYINDLSKSEKSDEFIKSLFKLELMSLDKSEDSKLVQLYNIVGFDKFFEIISIFENNTITLPKSDKIKKLLLISIVQYLVNGVGISPKEVGKEINKRLELNGIKQKSIKNILKALDQDLTELSMKALDSLSKEAVNGK